MSGISKGVVNDTGFFEKKCIKHIDRRQPEKDKKIHQHAPFNCYSTRMN